MDREEFSTMCEDVLFNISKDRKKAFISGPDDKSSRIVLAGITLSSGSMYMLCKSIVDLVEKEGEAFDYAGRKVLISGRKIIERK